MEQIVLDACKLFSVDPASVVESSIHITEADVSFVINLGIHGSPKLRFYRTGSTQLTYDRSQSAFLRFAANLDTMLSEVVMTQPQPAVASEPVATVNVGFAKTQQVTPQKLAWEQRRKKLAKES